LVINPNAFEILDEIITELDNSYELLSSNTNINIINHLKENEDKIDWVNFSCNPSIFTYDYEKMRNMNVELKNELFAKVLHPKRIMRLIEEFGEELIYDIYFTEE
jgi:hypothetical protein